MANEPNFEQLIPIFWIVEKDVQLVESCGYGSQRKRRISFFALFLRFSAKNGGRKKKSIFLENTGKIFTSTDLQILAHPFCVLSKYRSSLAFRFSFIFWLVFQVLFKLFSQEKNLPWLTYSKIFFLSQTLWIDWCLKKWNVIIYTIIYVYLCCK